MDGEKVEPETSKESFLKAFMNISQGDKDSRKDREVDINTDDLEADDIEMPLVLWLPNTLVANHENPSLDKSKKGQVNETKSPEKMNLMDGKAVEMSETLLEEPIPQPTNGDNQETFVIEKDLADGLSKQVNNFLEEAPVQTKDHQKPKLPASKWTEAPPTIHSFTQEQVGFEELLRQDPVTIKKLPKQGLNSNRSAVNTDTEVISFLDEEITQVESFLPKTDDSEVTHPNKSAIETELGNLTRQMPQATLATVNQEVPEVVKVSAKHWVSEVETIVMEQIDSNSNGNKTVTTRLQLTPEKLGEMDIELVIQNKKLTAKIVVEHPETKEWLEQKVQKLNTTLATQDIQVNDIQITIGKQTQEMIDAGVQDSPFFQQKEQQSKQKKSLSQPVEEEQAEEKYYKKTNSNNGRLSIWV